jgi:transcriptional regulator with XRE-family HTH domain
MGFEQREHESRDDGIPRDAGFKGTRDGGGMSRDGGTSREMGAEQAQPEAVERFLERLRAVKERTGKTLAELEKVGIASKSALSRYFNGQVIIPEEVLAALCKLAGTTPQESDELKQLRIAADKARSGSGSAQAQQDPDGGEQSDQSAPSPEPATLRRRRHWITYASVVRV